MVSLLIFIHDNSFRSIHSNHFPAANQMAAQMAGMNPVAANPFQPGQDPDKMYRNEAENLEVMEHYCILDGIEERLLHNLE